MELTKEYLYENYILKNKTEQGIADELGIGVGKVDYWIRKLGVNVKISNPDSFLSLTNIDKSDPIFCYYAGLCATDGYLDYKNHRVSVRVGNEGSKEVLEALKNYFSFSGIVRQYGRNNISNDLTIASPKILKELESMGIEGKKDSRSFSLDWYYSATKDCRRMFLRGVLDGDGSINKVGGAVRIAMGSEPFITKLRELVNHVALSPYKEQFSTNSTKKNYPAIMLRKADSETVLKFIYEGFITYRFSDKYKKYCKIYLGR